MLMMTPILGVESQTAQDQAALISLAQNWPILVTSYGWNNNNASTACDGSWRGVQCFSGTVVSLYVVFDHSIFEKNL